MRFKKVIRFFKILVPVILLLIIILALVAKLTEDEITDIAIKQISESVEAPISIGKATFTLIRKFPYATIKLEDVQMGSGDSNTYADTLVNFRNIFVSVKSKPLLKKRLEIVQVELEGVAFHYLVDSKGKSNFDFLLTGGDTLKSDTSRGLPLRVNLEQLLLKEVRFNYVDSAIGARGSIYIPELELNGAIDADLLMAHVEGEIELSDCDFQNTTLHYLSTVKVSVDAGINGDTLHVKDIQIEADEGQLNIEGLVIGVDTPDVDLRITGQHLRLAEFRKYIPQSFINKIDLRSIEGELFFNSAIEGRVIPEQQPHIAAEVQIHGGSVQIDTFPKIEDLFVKLRYTNGKSRNKQTSRVDCPELRFKALESTGNLSFSLRNLEELNYTAKVNSYYNLEEFAPFVPDSIIKNFTGYATMELETRGSIPDSVDKQWIDDVLENTVLSFDMQKVNVEVDSAIKIDSISASIAYLPGKLIIEDMTAFYKAFDFELTNGRLEANLLGSFEDGVGVDILQLELYTGSSTIAMKANLASFDTMDYSFHSELDLNLEDFSQFLPDSLIQSVSGIIKMDIAANGTLNMDSIPAQIENWIYKEASLNIAMNDIAVTSDNLFINSESISSSIKFSEDSLTILSLSGDYQGTTFQFDTIGVKNLYRKLVKKEGDDLTVFGDFNFGKADYATIQKLLASNEKVDDASVENDAATLEDTLVAEPFGFLMKGRFSVEEFKYNDALFTNINGLMSLSDSLYLVDKLVVNAFGGKMENALAFKKNKKGQQVLFMKNRVEGMDVKRVLRDMDHFGQNEIDEDNVSGILSLSLDSRLVIEGDSIRADLIRSQGEIKLEEGGVYNYAPVVELEKFLPGVNGLENLKFKTLNSNVFVFKNAIYVPQTLVVTNEFDAVVFGMKSFGDDYSYHAEVFLMDLLTGKSNRQKRKQDEQGEEVTDLNRNGIKVRSFSENGKRKNGRDNDSDRKATSQQIKISKKLLSVLFDPRVTSYNTGVEEK